MDKFRVICTVALALAPVTFAKAFADDRYVHVAPSYGKGAVRGKVRSHVAHVAHVARATRVARGARVARAAHVAPLHGLAAVAHQYLGRNPTGMHRRWCGAFMRHVVRQSGFPDNAQGNLARSWSSYGRPAAPGAIGAIAVMSGHVGIVVGACERGFEVISGNHNGTTGYGCYPARRIVAWRHPG